MESKANKNTYIESRTLWNDVYGSLQTKLENSYRVIFCLSIAIVVSIIGFIVVACQPKVKPIPFVLHGNDVITLSDQQSTAFDDVKPKLSLVLVEDFIRHARLISPDNTVNAENHINALSVVSGSASKALQSYFQSESTKNTDQNITQDIEITNVLRESKISFEVRWIETIRNAQTSEVISKSNYIADISYQFETPSSNPIILKHNPFGFFINHFSWSRDISSVSSAQGV